MMSTPLSRRSMIAAGASFLVPPTFAATAPAAIADYEHATGGRVGFSARNAATGREIAWRANERFTMCSTFKASLAALVLSRVDAGREQLDRRLAYTAADIQPYAPAAKEHLAEGSMTVAAMCQAAVEISDNTCANVLLREVSGPAALTRFWRSIGDSVSRLDHNEPELNRSKPPNQQDTTTPAAMARTIAMLTTGHALSPASRERLVGWLVACQTGVKKLRAGLPPDWRVGDKTGNNGSDAQGDIAIAWPPGSGPIAVCVYVQGGKPTPEQQDVLFAALGRLVAERLR